MILVARGALCLLLSVKMLTFAKMYPWASLFNLLDLPLPLSFLSRLEKALFPILSIKIQDQDLFRIIGNVKLPNKAGSVLASLNACSSMVSAPGGTPYNWKMLPFWRIPKLLKAGILPDFQSVCCDNDCSSCNPRADEPRHLSSGLHSPAPGKLKRVLKSNWKVIFISWYQEDKEYIEQLKSNIEKLRKTS